MIQIEVFWLMTPQHHTASQPRRPRLETSSWKRYN